MEFSIYILNRRVFVMKSVFSSLRLAGTSAQSGSLSIFCHHFAQGGSILSGIKHGDYSHGKEHASRWAKYFPIRVALVKRVAKIAN